MDVIFVDWYKTLSISLFWERRHDSRLPAALLAEVSRYVFGQHRLIRDWMLGTMAAEDVCALAADYIGLRTEDVLADLKHSCRRMEFCDPSVVDALGAIRRRGIKVVLASDNMDTFRRWTVPALQLDTIFDDVLTSNARGALKTDLVDGKSAFFTPWLADRGIAPSRAILIDDHRVPAAEAIGMAVRLVEDPSKLMRALTGVFGSCASLLSERS